MSSGTPSKVALVTGGASGIGLATVRRFVQDGMTVVVGDVSSSALDAVAAELGEAVVTSRCDVTVEEDVDALAGLAVGRFGRLDVAFANAGIGTNAVIVESDLSVWRSVVDVCLVGVFLTIKHAARRMERGGSIVVTTSLNAVQPGIGMSAYCAAKAAATMLVEVAALELGPSGIRVNAVGPGLVRTRMSDPMWRVPSVIEEFEDNTPLRRYAQPDEIADLVAFLASEKAGYINGSLYLIDGGAHTMRYPNLPARLAEASR